MTTQFIQSCFTNFKAKSPLVHNITNDVANNTVANVLLASGASPAMVCDINEAPEFVGLANVLALNIGTLTQTSLDSMLATAKSALSNHTPWVLDPVAVGATAYRQQACQKLLQYHPTIIRGNASEILALAGMDSQSRGTDSGDSVQSAQSAAKALTQYAKVVVVTGAVDYVTDGNQSWSVHHGDPLMTQVTAIGCALTALIAGFVGSNPDSIGDAAATALAYYGQAGEIAAKTAQGPGSFYVQFLDALYTIDAAMVASQSKVVKS